MKYPSRTAKKIEIDRFVFETDDADGLGLCNGAPFEPEVLDALRRYIQPGDVVLDVGANVGYFTAFMASYVGPSGHVHAFEPEPRNYELLQRNVSQNCLDNVSTYNLALGETAGTAHLHISEFSGGLHRLYDSFCCGEATVAVPVRKLDDMFDGANISVMKIDVEGFEPYVLKGATGLMERGNITFISEYCPPAILEAGASPMEFLYSVMSARMLAYEAAGPAVDWQALTNDATKWESFGKARLVLACSGKSNPEIAQIVSDIGAQLGCARPYIENLAFVPG